MECVVLCARGEDDDIKRRQVRGEAGAMQALLFSLCRNGCVSSNFIYEQRR